MDGEMIRVVIKRPDEKPVTAVMENTLTAFQRAVEGYIETVNLGGRDGHHLFVGFDGEDSFRTLSTFEIDTLMDMLGGYDDEND